MKATTIRVNDVYQIYVRQNIEAGIKDSDNVLIKGDCHMQIEGIKQEAYRILEQLPDKATWDDLMYQIYVRQNIEAGIKDSDNGRTIDVKEVRKKFGLTK